MPVRKPAYDRALDALARRARTEQELRRWLRDRGYAAADVAETIERLLASGLLDDAKYSAAYAQTALVGRGLSRRRVLAELARRGVARDVAEAAVAGVIADYGVSEESAVESLAARKWRTLQGRARTTAERRLFGYLARLGYDLDTVRTIIRRLARED